MRIKDRQAGDLTEAEIHLSQGTARSVLEAALRESGLLRWREDQGLVDLAVQDIVQALVRASSGRD